MVNFTVKLSLLFFYCRVFPLPEFYRQAFFMGALVTAWYIGSALVIIFQCTPVYKAWHKERLGKCINMIAFVLGYELTNALIDIALILLPVRMVQDLKLDRRQKILVSSVFMLGGL